MKNILIGLFILSTVLIYAGESNLNTVEGMTEDFYYKFFGVWDHEASRHFEGTPMGFSWGKGEVLKNSSTIVDYNLLGEKGSLNFYGLGLYMIIKIEELSNTTYKIILYEDYDNITGTIIVHWLEDYKIWFETVNQYEFSKGIRTKMDLSYGEIAYDNGDVITGPENLYYRRSGPVPSQ